MGKSSGKREKNVFIFDGNCKRNSSSFCCRHFVQSLNYERNSELNNTKTKYKDSWGKCININVLYIMLKREREKMAVKC